MEKKMEQGCPLKQFQIYGAVQLFGKNGYSVGHNGLGAAIDEG